MSLQPKSVTPNTATASSTTTATTNAEISAYPEIPVSNVENIESVINPEIPATTEIPAPVEYNPVEAEPVEAEPVEAEPVEAEPEAEPVEAEPEAEPVEPEPEPEAEAEAEAEPEAEAEAEAEPEPEPEAVPPSASAYQIDGVLESKLEQRIRAELPIFAEDSGVNSENIIKNIAKYIKNLKSSEYKQYLNALENLYSKVGKRAKIYNENNTVYLITSLASDISKKSNIIASVKKPKLVDINLKLDEARRTGDVETFETFRIYKHLVNHRSVMDYEEDDEKHQEYELFLNKLEHRSLENDTIIVNTDKYMVPQILVDDINITNIKKLDDYNALMEKIRNKKLKLDKDLKTTIKEYLEQPKISMNEFKNKKKINFAILELPTAL